MSESSKLLLGAALVAIGFGVATMLGPPQAQSDWQASLGPANGRTAATTDSLQLRANDYRVASSPVAPQNTPVINNSTAPAPQWLKPVTGIQPTGNFSANSAGQNQFASATMSGPGTARQTNRNEGIEPIATSPSLVGDRYAGEVKTSSNQAIGQFPPAAPLERQPLQDYDDSHWLEDQVSPTEQQQHIVADGDTLAAISEMYLGDTSREWEIYQLNRDELKSPALLPIGAVLTIPARTPVETPVEAMEETPEVSVVVEAPPLEQRTYSEFVLDNQPRNSVSPELPPTSETQGYFATNDNSQSGYYQADYASNPVSASNNYQSDQPDLVPVKPISTGNEVPRAQLMQPIAVE